MAKLRSAAIGLIGIFVLAPQVTAQQPFGAVQLGRHLAGGEFLAAADAAGELPGAGRDGVLAQVAAAQSSAGESVAAAGTIRGISSPPAREEAIRGAGGGAFADFQSLIDLIQTTVVPDTWEALGGPSTMAPYPAGVYVDGSGTIHECEAFSDSDAVANLRALLGTAAGANAPQPADWRRPAAMRCVSLKRVRDELARYRLDGSPIPEPLSHLAGLSRIQYLFVSDDDIIVAGPVGGVDNFHGWYRDRETGLIALRLDFLLTTLQSTLANQPFGCTIDPTRQGLQNAAKVAAGVQADSIPIGKAAEEMVSALGMQTVEVFGTAGDTPIGYLMVEADRHMKELALGIEPMPQGAHNYVDVIDSTIANGPPSELLLRLWFTAAPRAVRADEAREVFELAGTPIRLSGQNERAVASGQRGHITRDPRTEVFVAQFNEHWSSIREKYPIYGALESIYRVASVAELLERYADAPDQANLVRSLADHASSMPRMRAAPRQVLSIAKLHTVRHGKKRHHILLASGGVAVDARQTLTSKISDYPSLESLKEKPIQAKPPLIQRWWWDIAR